MNYRLIAVVLTVVLFASCGGDEKHPISKGSCDKLIPLPDVLVPNIDGNGDAVMGFYCDGNLVVAGSDYLGISKGVVDSWFKKTGVQLEYSDILTPQLSFSLDSAVVGEEAYVLDIKNELISVVASTPEGLFRGFTTLRLIMPAVAETGGCSSGFLLPEVHIEDSPEFEHRGLLLDCCRHFMEPEFVKKMIDNLSLHKMNVLHWHLTEDQGWRIQIDAYPKLTEVGAWRTELDGTTHGGFYTKDQIRDIVAYASERHVEIIPEIEVPGHSQAALASYPHLGCTGEQLPVANKWGVFKDIYCAGNDSTLQFLEAVFDEVCELFPSNRIHIGGDEAPKVRWAACEKCSRRIEKEGLKDEHELQTWIIEYVGQYLESKGKTIIGWDEILEGGLPEGAAVQSWRGMAGAIEGVHLGTDVISSPTSHCYLDYPLSSTDLREVYSFDPMPEEASHGPGRVLGGECNMWSERAPQHLVESKVFPRAIGLAEVLWSGIKVTSKEGAYERFIIRLDPHLSRLALLGVDYGLEAVPVSMSLSLEEREKSALFANITPAGSYIRGEARFVSTSGEEGEAVTFDKPVEVTGPGEVVATINYRGRVLDKTENFPVDFHAGSFKEIELSYEPSPYYTGGGEYALVDSRVGSMDFRDGVWQAVQGEDMEIRIDLGGEVEIDSISLNFYLYQDAWIFMPSTVLFIVDGKLEYEIANDDSFEKDDKKTVRNLSSGSLEGVKGRNVVVKISNPGVCPDWHAAATEPTWLFVDELVVRAVGH